MKATIWHNPRCSKSREALAILHDAGRRRDDRRVSQDPPTRAELARLYARAGITPRDALRNRTRRRNAATTPPSTRWRRSGLDRAPAGRDREGRASWRARPNACARSCEPADPDRNCWRIERADRATVVDRCRRLFPRRARGDAEGASTRSCWSAGISTRGSSSPATTTIPRRPTDGRRFHQLAGASARPSCRSTSCAGTRAR